MNAESLFTLLIDVEMLGEIASNEMKGLRTNRLRNEMEVVGVRVHLLIYTNSFVLSCFK